MLKTLRVLTLIVFTISGGLAFVTFLIGFISSFYEQGRSINAMAFATLIHIAYVFIPAAILYRYLEGSSDDNS